MRIDVHTHADPETVAMLRLILANQEQIMSTLDDVLADVTAEATAIDSLSALTAGLKQQLADALAGVALPPNVQAKIDTVFAGLEANKQKVIDAISANTDSARPS